MSPQLKKLLPVVVFALIVLGVFAVHKGILPDPTGTISTSEGPAPTVGHNDPATAKQQLAALTVAAEGSMAGYSREKFQHWITQDGKCDTRETVIKRDGTDVQVDAACKATSGTWFSPYDDKKITKATELDIDHWVPLAAAWRSGAKQWTDEQRKQFANDLTHHQLIAVSAASNRSKGDQSPDTWKPPSTGFWCVYASNWVEVKSVYGLTINPAEKTALTEMLGRC
ncbi:HNH endonuclease [Pseudonocardiaceae bacterium YIM PH 21723]|nr:HNH endonuclease [Pseudonocardiaceae bacterium YIM PH 21723]